MKLLLLTTLLVCLQAAAQPRALEAFEQNRRLGEALRGNRAPVVAEVLLPDGTRQIIRERRQPEEDAGDNDQPAKP